MNAHDPEIARRWPRIVNGDTEEFAAFVDQHKNLVTSIAYAMIGDLAGTEDIAQETFLVAWQSRHELSEPEKVVGWLSSIARNLARQWVRKRSARSWPAASLDSTDIQQPQPHPSERLVSEEEQQLIWNSLEAIPASYREVMVLYYRQSHSINEVAIALEISEEAARQRLARGRNLLRAEVERTIESALAASRPSVHFTSAVMAMIVVGSSSTLGKAATTAAGGLIGKSVAQGTLLAASQAATTGAAVGAAGGLMGILGGLGGTWLGVHVPQMLAPTMTERKLLAHEGRFVWRFSLIYLMATLVSLALAFVIGPSRDVIMITVFSNLAMGLAFGIFCIVRGIKINRKVKHIRETISPEEDPNPTWLKDRMGLSNATGQSSWEGRRTTSKLKLFGWPIYDFQVSDPVMNTKPTQGLHAKGWIAVGDQATGFVAIGGIAKGFIALGGLALGIVSSGGLSVGLLSFGGLTLGLLSIGGVAAGHSAIGGCAIGWQAVGGAAVGIYSANGGLAIAGTIAEGGGAYSWKYAVGGDARAPEANTDLARSECRKSWASSYMSTEAILKDLPRFRRLTVIYTILLPVSFGMLSFLMPLLMYRRQVA